MAKAEAGCRLGEQRAAGEVSCRLAGLMSDPGLCFEMPWLAEPSMEWYPG